MMALNRIYVFSIEYFTGIVDFLWQLWANETLNGDGERVKHFSWMNANAKKHVNQPTNHII